MAVTFLFSVPTTWTRMAIINIFKDIVRDAGFGVEGLKRIAQIDLTEAEAAAYLSKREECCSGRDPILHLQV